MKKARLLLVPALLSPLGACSREGAHAPPPEASPLRVTVAPAHGEPLPVLYRASGTVRGRSTATLTSKTVGYVRAVNVRPGDLVTAGQVLAELEANDARASVARARAGLIQTNESRAEAESAVEAARVAAKVAQASFERSRALLAQGAISQQDYDDDEARSKGAAAQEAMARARLRALSSSIEEARAGLAETQALLGYAKIQAPFAGRVLERHVDPGALASPGTPLLVIADEGTLRVEASVEESRAPTIAIGDDASVEIEALPSPVVGKVSEVVPSVDPASRAFTVKVDLPPSTVQLRPGAFARVAFRIGTENRLVVPTSAVSSFGALDRVFVVDGDRARLRLVTLGEAAGPWSVVLSGLSADERIVASLSPELQDGRRVTVQP